MSATARPSVSNRPSIVDGLAYVLPDVFIAEILPKLNLISTLNLAQVSKWYRDAVSAALPRTFDFEGVAGDLAGHLVRLLDDPRVRSLGKERALELIGVHKDRLCEYACVQRNFEVLKWARDDLGLPWAPYPPGHVSDDVLVLRVLRETWPQLTRYWRVAAGPEEWRGVTMDGGRVVELELGEMGLTGAVPAEIGQLTSLAELWLDGNQLTSVPAEIGRLTSLTMLYLQNNQLTSVPAEIGQLAALKVLSLSGNQLTSVPAEIGQLTSLRVLSLYNNKLTSVPAEIGQLTSLRVFWLYNNKLTSVPAEIGQLTSLTRLDLYGNQLTSLPTEIGQLTSLERLYLGHNQLTSVPTEIGQLTSLRKLGLQANQLTSVPAGIWRFTSLESLGLGGNKLKGVPTEIGQLTSLRELDLRENQLTSVSAAIRKLRAAGCQVHLDDAVTVDE
jgi:Leucine-rich repeat (LRR) protein